MNKLRESDKRSKNVPFGDYFVSIQKHGAGKWEFLSIISIDLQGKKGSLQECPLSKLVSGDILEGSSSSLDDV